MIQTDKISQVAVFDIELEKSILYCLIHSKDIQRYFLKIEQDDFYNLTNKAIFEELLKIYSKEKEVLPETIGNLKYNNNFLDILNHTSSIANFKNYFKRFKELSELRKAYKIANEIAVKVKERRTPREIKSYAITEFEKIKGMSDVRFEAQNDEIDEAFSDIIADSNLISVRSGYKTLDKIIRGFLKGSFNIIAAAQGMGKTSFVLNLINNICKKGKKVLFVSLEMDFELLHGKMISLISGVDFQKIVFDSQNLTDMEWKKVTDARADLSGYKLLRMGDDETTALDIEEVIKELKDIDIVFIDYLQRMKPNEAGKNLRETITNISRELSGLARKTGIPIVAVSSINRDYAKRDDREPRISDLKESGALEYDATTVLLMHRPCKFRDADSEKGENAEDFEKEAEIIIAKNRFGQDNLKINFYFDGAKGLLKEMQESRLLGKVIKYPVKEEEDDE